MELAFAPQLERKRAPVKSVQPTRPKVAAAAAVQRKPADASRVPAYLGHALAQGDVTVRPAGDELEQEADRIAALAASYGAPARAVREPGPGARSSQFLPMSTGAPLDPAVRARVEPLLGADLAHVRVHSDADAQELAAGLQARAFTHRNHIYLGSGEHGRDVSLLAHEATHVVQQAGPAKSAVQRQFGWAHTQHPGMPAYPTRPHLHPTAPSCDPRALAALDTETVELKGTSTFNPSYWLAEGLWCILPDTSLVRAQFGTLANGVLRMRAIPLPTMTAPGATGHPSLSYETASDEEFLELHHPSFPGGGFDYPPRLYVSIHDGIVTGRIRFFPGMGRVWAVGVDDWVQGYSLARFLGWNGLKSVRPASIVNELSGGVLRYGFPSYQFRLDDHALASGMVMSASDLGGTGDFSVTDESETWHANADIQGEGILPGDMPLRKLASRISGSASLSLNLHPIDAFGGTFSGSLTGNYANGALTIQGTATYRSRKVNGSITLLFAPRFQAWTRVLSVLPGSPNAPGVTIGQTLDPGYVLVGWGTVNFAINRWLNGSVSVVVDPDGFITSHGILRPTVEFQFLREDEAPQTNVPLAHLEGHIGVVPPPFDNVVSIGGTAYCDLVFEGRVGPGRVYGLEVEGTFSTRPGSVFEARATGRVNLSAWARLRATLGGDFGVRMLRGRVGTIGVEGSADATVRAYVEIQPTFERILSATDPATADYRITGELEAAAALSVGLSGRIVATLLGSEVWTRNLGRVEWRLASIGMHATVSHVIGSHDPISLELESADFDDAKFGSTIENIVNRRGDPNSGDHSADLDQDATTRPPDRPDTPTVASLEFPMSGVTHTLSVEHAPDAKVMMQSEKGRLVDKLGAEIRNIEEQKRGLTGDAAAELDDQIAEARRISGEARAVEERLNELQSETREASDVAGFHEVADALTTFASQTDKTDLAQPSPPPSTGFTITSGRYVITNRAEFDAVKAVQPSYENPPEGVMDDPELADYWQRYTQVYFPERMAEIEGDITRTGRSARRGPRTWESYVPTRRRFDPIRERKAFQPELRGMILAEDPNLAAHPERVEIDVGLRPTRRGVPRTTYFADVVVADPANNSIVVYSCKVHDVKTFAVGKERRQVVQWINARMAEDVDEAAQNYGYGVNYRRERESDPATGRAGGRGSPDNPLYNKNLYVNQVNLVWRYTSGLIPDEYIGDVRDAGAEHGVRQRRRAAFPVTFQLRPSP